MQAQDAGALLRDLEGVRNATGSDGHPARGDPVLGPVHVHQDLAGQDVHRLVGIRMGVQGRDLVEFHFILEQQERPGGVFLRGLPGLHASAEEPAPCPFAGLPDNCGC